jgi:hypothetical protein
MRKKFDFKERADECALRAATARNDRAREVWVKMEEYWRRRAANSEATLVPKQPRGPLQPARPKRDRVT